MLARFSNWAQLLDGFLLENRDRKFRYGQWDCCLFAADAIAAMTGHDIAASFRGRYDSYGQAIRRIRECCGRSSIAAIAESTALNYSMPELVPRLAARGDMILIKRPRDHSLGIVALNGLDIIIPAQSQLCRVPLDLAVKAWRV